MSMGLVAGFAVMTTAESALREQVFFQFPLHKEISSLIDNKLEQHSHLVAVANIVARVVEKRTLDNKELQSIIRGCIKEQFRYDKIADEKRKEYVDILFKFFNHYKLKARL